MGICDTTTHATLAAGGYSPRSQWSRSPWQSVGGDLACENDEIEIRRGRNVWVLARTDRDAPTRQDVIETAAAFLRLELGRASPLAQRSIFELIPSPKAGGARYFIGAARPVLITAAQANDAQDALENVPRPGGELLGTWLDCPVLRGVRAQVPWFVSVAFDWRAPDVRIAWPRRAVDPFGFPLDDQAANDWLLLVAAHQGEAQQSDSTLLDEATEETRKAARRALSGGAGLLVLGGLAVAGAAIYLAEKRRR